MSVYDYHKPTDDQIRQMELVRQEFKVLTAKLDSMLPPGRYKSMVMTDLEAAAVWCNKSLTHVAGAIVDNTGKTMTDPNAKTEGECTKDGSCTSEKTECTKAEGCTEGAASGEAKTDAAPQGDAPAAA